MVNQRLSKLQKFILRESYRSVIKILGMRAAYRSRLLLDFFKVKTPAAEASLSRSVWSLVKKGLVEGISSMPLELVAFVYGAEGKTKEQFKKDFELVLKEPSRFQKVPAIALKGSKIKFVGLTSEGEKRARKLLKVK